MDQKALTPYEFWQQERYGNIAEEFQHKIPNHDPDEESSFDLSENFNPQNITE